MFDWKAKFSDRPLDTLNSDDNEWQEWNISNDNGEFVSTYGAILDIPNNIRLSDYALALCRDEAQLENLYYCRNMEIAAVNDACDNLAYLNQAGQYIYQTTKEMYSYFCNFASRAESSP